jgi:uncharacterized protein YpmB
MKQQINEIKRMQQLAGLITESKYQESLSEETNEETLDDVTFTLDMALNDIFPMYGFKAGDTVTGILPAEEFADETKRNSAEDFQAAQAYIKNKGGEIKINSSDPYLMFRNINITYKLKDNGDVEYAVEVPAKKMDEAQLNENISDEAIERIEGLANTHHLSTLKFSLENLVPEWIQDGGFDEDDVIDYLTHLVRNSY